MYMSARTVTTIALAAALAVASTPVLAQRGKPTGRAGTPPTAPAPAPSPKLRYPAALKEVAPAEYRVAFDTSAGPFVIAVRRAWAPKGADRFYNLVKYGFFNGCRFFRVMSNFMVQFGLNGNPTIQAPWSNASITDDPVKQSNRRGTISFATAGPNTRTTQVFINFKNNAGLDAQGFSPFGEVVSGMDAVDKINAEYGEHSNQQDLIKRQGNAYLSKSFPRLDYVKTATIEEAPATSKK
jgi:peptidyl-prolyl cis-trans isomerase A (cyclophilin A)